ncbi:hypothetical protein AVEN_227261-1 [Araneus ventricosus]|uniref:Uncharacterized protein n=1 Tax=Araneus ventricosus TaxID=182803 RepID=A0A4Y2V6C3_ARAVE|nr:hypothetical protein AVEN_227261-1 [Araneus ventricosus]
MKVSWLQHTKFYSNFKSNYRYADLVYDMFDMLAINGSDVVETKSKSLQKSLKCRNIDTTISLELFNHIFDCYNTWTGCFQLVLGRKFPLRRNRAVIARIVGLEDRRSETLYFDIFNEK